MPINRDSAGRFTKGGGVSPSSGNDPLGGSSGGSFSSGTVRVGTSFTINTKEFKKFARALRRSSKEINREFKAGLRSAGMIVAAEARRNANALPQSDKPSGTSNYPKSDKRIADTIKVRTRGISVQVTAGDKSLAAGSPGNAAAVERGGRHPVFGNIENWQEQEPARFLERAMEDKADEVEAAAADVVQRAMERAAHLYL